MQLQAVSLCRVSGEREGGREGSDLLDDTAATDAAKLDGAAVDAAFGIALDGAAAFGAAFGSALDGAAAFDATMKGHADS